MKNALEWIKSNPVSVAAMFVGLIGLLVFAYFYFLASAGFRTDAKAKLEGPASQMGSLLGASVPMPAENPNDPPIDERVVINPAVIQVVGRVYDGIRDQAAYITGQTISKNRSDHNAPQAMLGGGQLWPEPNAAQSSAVRELARQQYVQVFESLFKPGSATLNMPAFAVAMPPRPDEIQFKLNETAFNFINSIGVTAQTALTQSQAEQLYAEQRMELMKLLTDRARSINLYVQLPVKADPSNPGAQPGGLEGFTSGPNPGLIQQPPGGFGEFGPGPGAASGLGNAGSNQATGYPFKLAPWTQETRTPTLEELWEAQVELWIIRDVMRAIYQANHVGSGVTTTNASGQQVRVQANVLNSPIKRLITLRPLPFYVGLHTRGGVLVKDGNYDALGAGENLGGSADDAGFSDSFDDFSDFSAPPTPGGTTTAQAGLYPKPGVSTLPDPTENAPNHFGLTPTGRVSNSVFDVRHTVLTIDIEWDALPGFMETLRQVNFMSVIKVKLTDLDEYELLQQGFVYGGKDVVRAELLIESLWFREWTAPFMPKSVKERLLIAPPDNQGDGLGI